MKIFLSFKKFEFSLGYMEKTIENLTKAFIGESQARNRYTFYSKIAKKEGFEQIADEHTTMYPEFADVADKEGLPEIAGRLKSIAVAEKHHEERYQKLLKELDGGTVFKKDKEVWWVCRECGYVYFGKEPPKKCPSCDHAQSYYEVKREEY